MLKFAKKLLAFVFMLAMVVFMLPSLAYASEKTSTPVGNNIAWIRAKLVYEYDEGITGLNDSIVNFAENWKKTDGWYYYKKPVNSGDRVRFITGLRVPTEWTNDLIDKRFHVIVHVEASEVALGDTGWDENTEISYSKTFDIWNVGYAHDEDVWVEEGHLTVSINEYQLDKEGNEVPYVNDKVIMPGQPISKIVEFEIGGKKGGNIKLIPKKPVKTVEVAGVNVDGKNVNGGTALTYKITVENPAPDKREITITDTVDERLRVTDTGGGTFITEPVNGMGGTLEWKVWVEGFESATVHFLAKAPEGVTEEDPMVISNTAEAMIVGKKVKSNTVIVGLGNPSELKKIIARATGDPGQLVLAVCVAIGLIVAAISVMMVIMKKRKSEDGVTNNKTVNKNKKE